MLLAESVSIDGGTLLLILAAMAAMVVAWCALVYAGFRLARSAGEGSGRALAAWVVVAVLHSLPLLIPPTPWALVAVGLVALQYRRFQRARSVGPGEAG